MVTAVVQGVGSTHFGGGGRGGGGTAAADALEMALALIRQLGRTPLPLKQQKHALLAEELRVARVRRTSLDSWSHLWAPKFNRFAWILSSRVSDRKQCCTGSSALSDPTCFRNIPGLCVCGHQARRVPAGSVARARLCGGAPAV